MFRIELKIAANLKILRIKFTQTVWKRCRPADGCGKGNIYRSIRGVPRFKTSPFNAGGGFFAFADLLAPKSSGVKEEMERFDMSASEKAREYLNRNVYFGISHAPVWGKAQIECAVKVLGADHVLFGGSYPVRREWLLKGVDFVQSLDVGEEEKAMVLGENAIKIFGLN